MLYDSICLLFEHAYVCICRADGSGPFLSKDVIIFTLVGPFGVMLPALILCFLPLKLKEQWWGIELINLASSYSTLEVLCFTHGVVLLQVYMLTRTLIHTLLGRAGKDICDAIVDAYKVKGIDQVCFELKAHLIMPEWILLVVACLAVHANHFVMVRFFRLSSPASSNTDHESNKLQNQFDLHPELDKFALDHDHRMSFVNGND